MSSELFESREDDFQILYDDMKRKVEHRLPSCIGEERKRLIREVERGLEEGTLLIQEMEEELKKAPSVYRSQMVSRMRNYRRDLELLDKQLKQGTSGSGTGRRNVSFNPDDEFDAMENSQRARLMAGSESLNRASQSIARSQQVAVETDQIGADIIDELGTQRESLHRTRDRLTDTDEELKSSRKILKSMARRVMTNKLILIVIIVMELAILAGVVYWKFFS